jgi:excisionase family DNA binding protein
MELMMSAMKPTLNFKEACRYTGLSSSQLYKLVQGDEVPYAKPTGKLIFFDKAELDHWMCNKLEIEGKEYYDRSRIFRNTEPR